MLTKALIAGKASHLNANHSTPNEEQMHYTLSNELQAQGLNKWSFSSIKQQITPADKDYLPETQKIKSI